MIIIIYLMSASMSVYIKIDHIKKGIPVLSHGAGMRAAT